MVGLLVTESVELSFVQHVPDADGHLFGQGALGHQRRVALVDILTACQQHGIVVAGPLLSKVAFDTSLYSTQISPFR